MTKMCLGFNFVVDESGFKSGVNLKIPASAPAATNKPIEVKLALMDSTLLRK